MFESDWMAHARGACYDFGKNMCTYASVIEMDFSSSHRHDVTSTHFTALASSLSTSTNAENCDACAAFIN